MIFTDFHLFCGIGGGAVGFKKARAEYKGMVGQFRTLGGIDCDPQACADFAKIVDSPVTQMDLFSREDYIAFHGHEPPEDWREAEPWDIYRAAGHEYPDVVFLSPPCKGFSGLLPAQSAASDKYQALNKLVVRSMKLVTKAFEENLPSAILIENVPRITSRGAALLKEVKKVLGAYGYVFNEATHDCGEIGGLGQHRKRYLLIARNKEKMPAFIYKPPKQKLKTIGDVIGPLPLPGDPAMGPLHRLPKLQWKTWVRLALIPAGGDWRDLQNIDHTKYGIQHVPRQGSFGVMDWDEPSGPITGNVSQGGSTPGAIADPRVQKQGFSNCYQLHGWDEAAGTVTGIPDIQSGAQSITDPRIGLKDGSHTALYRVMKFDEPGKTVTGAHGPNNGAGCINDPRVQSCDGKHPGAYRVVKFDEVGPCVTGTRFGSGSAAISDPRTCQARNGTYGVMKWDETAKTVLASGDIHAGAVAIDDPRIKAGIYPGSYGVQDWNAPAVTVRGQMRIINSPAAISDPRIPADTESGTWVLIAPDGTWHRPLTTLELAALQSLSLIMPDGSPLTLSGNSDARWREAIGNMVPPDAAEAIAGQILPSLMASRMGEWYLGITGIWVMPIIEQENQWEAIHEDNTWRVSGTQP